MGKIILNGTEYAGSGGSGGHTIVDPNGTDMPQENKLQFTGNVSVSDDSVNGQTVVNVEGGGGNVYGAFIDPARVVYSSFVFDSSAHTWTATEDCILTDNMLPPDSTTDYFIRIGGKQVFAGYSTVEDPFVYVKKGQVVEYRAKSGSSLKAYGVTQGTNGIFAPVIYSDTERVIGVWRDNKPLYQKTIDVGALPNSTTKTVNFDVANVDAIVKIFGIGIATTGACCPIPFTDDYSSAGNILLDANTSNGTIRLISQSDKSPFHGYITIQYTKTTDTAGSGSWTPSGVPSVHYSTNEQVIGTWIDGKPRYEITLSGSGSYSAGSELVVPLPTNADKVVIMGGYVDIGTDWLPLNLTLGVGTGTTNGVYCYPNKSTGVHIYSSAWTFSEYNVTVQYCKTTD